jgi:hypothetical protein
MAWTPDESIKRIEEKQKVFSLPKQPKTFGSEYFFPEDMQVLDSDQLGQWISRLSAWRGFVLRDLAKVESEAIMLEDSYDLAISRKLGEFEDPKKMSKDMIIGKVLNDPANAELKNLKHLAMEKRAEVNSLKRIVEIYTIQNEAVSREITRRSIEYKIATGSH